jgi:hypothetical protein
VGALGPFSTSDPASGQAEWSDSRADLGDTLWAVTCPGVSLCLAVGNLGILYTNTQPQRLGSWWSLWGGLGAGMPAITCVDGTSFCVAVDENGNAFVSQGSVPVVTDPPVISGTPSVGSELTCTTGTWTGSPYRYEYRWTRQGTPIANASEDSPRYTVQADDVGKRIGCSVVAVSAAAVSTAVATPTAPATARPSPAPALPLITVPVTLTPTAATVGTTLTCFTRVRNTTLTYVWHRDGAPIGPSSSDATRVLAPEDEGHQIRCTITATNSLGSISGTSDAVVPGPRAVVQTPVPTTAEPAFNASVAAGSTNLTALLLHGLPVIVRCSAQCKVIVRMTSGKRVLGRMTIVFQSKGVRRGHVHLDAKAKRWLRSKRVVRVKVSAKEATGRRVNGAKTLTIRASKRR